MKEYKAPTCEEFFANTVDVITASGDGIVAAQDQVGVHQTLETAWKEDWNSNWN